MEMIGLWLVVGAAVVIAGVCVMLLQKKAAEAAETSAELNSVKAGLERARRELDEIRKDNDGADHNQNLKIETLTKSLDTLKEQNAQLSAELESTGRQLQQAEERLDGKTAELAELSQKLEKAAGSGADAEKLSSEMENLKKELAAMTEKLNGVEKHFEAQMDEVVQSSIQKITHAEEAKEEAIQAAQDNFEAAAEANARLKEIEAQLKQLQGS